MRVFKDRNVNWNFPHAVHAIQSEGITMDSRNGPVIEFNGPVATCYEKPMERVLFSDIRDGNPFFHFFESLWMLAGRNDLEFVTRFTKNLTQYSDDGETMNGSAYGHRWREYFNLSHYGGGTDQLEKCIEMLRANPDDRRVVLQMWDPQYDLGSDSKDVPCNTNIFFRARPDLGGHTLDMTVCNRSNDIIYGCYGANVVHFSFLLEYVAAKCKMGVGRYWQMSNSLHAYTDTEVWQRCKDIPFTPVDDYYDFHKVKPFCMFAGHLDPELWDIDLWQFMADPEKSSIVNHNFFRLVARPLYMSHLYYKKKDRKNCMKHLKECLASDWKLVCKQWIERRWKYADEQADDR